MRDIWQQTLNWEPSEQVQEQFQRLYEFIVEGNRQLNLTRITQPEEFWEKHLWDSLRGIANYPTPIPSPQAGRGDVAGEGCASVIDIGTGGGFPGVPIAIAYPNCNVTLVDSTRKKIAFVQKFLSELEINNAQAIVGRAEEIAHQPQHRESYDLAVIRAVGSVSACAEYTLPLVKQGGLAVLYRGNVTSEEMAVLQKAASQLGGTVEFVDKFTTPLSNGIRNCIYLRKVASTPAKFPRAVGVPEQKPLS
jgi:16S rRNA (guanine527-N7)-methyltransferase